MIITVIFFAHWTCSLISIALVYLHRRERCGMPFSHLAFPTSIYCFPLFIFFKFDDFFGLPSPNISWMPSVITFFLLFLSIYLHFFKKKTGSLNAPRLRGVQSV